MLFSCAWIDGRQRACSSIRLPCRRNARFFVDVRRCSLLRASGHGGSHGCPRCSLSPPVGSWELPKGQAFGRCLYCDGPAIMTNPGILLFSFVIVGGLHSYHRAAEQCCMVAKIRCAQLGIYNVEYPAAASPRPLQRSATTTFLSCASSAWAKFVFTFSSPSSFRFCPEGCRPVPLTRRKA